MRFLRTRIYQILLATGVFVFLGHVSATAEEPCEEFLQALREERLFDVAIEYLDSIVDSSTVPQEFRDRIALHKVAILLDEASLIRDAKRLTAQLDRTEAILGEFIASNPRATLLAEAQEQRARVFMARAGRLLTRSESDRLTVDQRNELQEEARNYLTLASEAYEDIRARLRTELTKPLDRQNPEAQSERETMRNKYVLVRLQSPKIKEQIADSFGPDHPQYKTLLQESAQENLELYDKYRTRLTGIDGCLGAARCFQKLGEPDKSLGHLMDVFELPRGTVQLAKKREAALVAIDCWQQLNPFPLEEAFSRLRIVIYSLSPEYARTPQGVRIRMSFATTCQRLAATIRADGGPNSGEERTRLINLEKEATRIMRGLARTPGDHRKQAQQLLKDWGNSVADIDDEDKGPPKTMNEARERGKNLQLRVGQLKTMLSDKQTELAGTTDATQQTGLKNEITNLQKQVQADSLKALEMFELGLQKTTVETADDDISNIRYLQCASYYQMEMFFESAIIGEYLLREFPNGSGTQPAAGLVCKSYWNLYRASGKTGQDRTFERGKLVEICGHIFKTWPGSRQTEQAGLVMTLLTLAEGDPVGADQYVDEIPEDSPARSAIVLEVGNRLWQTYVRAKRKAQMEQGELLTVRDQAKKRLEEGVQYLKLENLSSYEARSALSLTELYLDSGLDDLAIEQLENARIAPLDLVKTKHTAAADPQFRRDTYKTSIRAYLAKLRNGENTLIWVEKSQGILGALKSEIGGTSEGKKQLSDIYLTLARELKEQFETLESNEQRTDFANGLESFLSALGSSSGDRNLMLLTGSMLSEIGQGLKDNDLTPQASRFFAQAVKVYETLSAGDEPDPRIRLEILRGRANSLRGSGDYKRAIAQFGDILLDPKNRMYTAIQVEAASTYSEWGLEKNDPDILNMAVRGGEKRKTADGKQATTIIGWVNLAKAAQRSQKNELLAEAVFNIARCKFRYGKIKGRQDLLQSSIDEVERFRTNTPLMGGPSWKPRLEQLLEKMKREKG